MNLHPIVVHFPIALLSVYSLIEIYRRWKPSHASKLEITRVLLLVIGIIGGRIALATGEGIEAMYNGNELEKIVQAHAAAANTSIVLYTILLVIVLIPMLQQRIKRWIPVQYHHYLDRLIRVINRFEAYHTRQVIAIVALLALLVTGALGGGLVYGSDVEPLTTILFKLILGH